MHQKSPKIEKVVAPQNKGVEKCKMENVGTHGSW
jgi:hypothetical protein